MTSIIVAIISGLATLSAGLGAVALGHILRERRRRPGANGSSTPAIKWGTDMPAAQSMLRGAQDSVLFLGVSQARIVDDDFKFYRDWLDFDAYRLIGLLFLNPSSPHAKGRDRSDVHRSAAEVTREKLSEARARHPRFIPAVYEGPYRYSARAVDAGFGRKKVRPRVSVFTSSHRGGTSAGFAVELDPVQDSDAFQHYREELLDLWREALSNPAGHGISIVSRGRLSVKPGEGRDNAGLVDMEVESERRAVEGETEVRTRLMRECEKLLGPIDGPTEFRLFSTQQFHATICSLCRTQRIPEAAPLSVGAEDKACRLPEHYADFVAEAVQAVRAWIVQQDIAFNPTLLALDETGYMSLHAPEDSESPATDHFECVLREMAELRAKYEQANPEDGWGDRLPEDGSYRFGPRHRSFIPHITIGRAFASAGPLPIPLLGQRSSLELSGPIQFVGNALSVVHYAYRSLLRVVGEARFPLDRMITDKASPIQLLRSLRI